MLNQDNYRELLDEYRAIADSYYSTVNGKNYSIAKNVLCLMNTVCSKQVLPISLIDSACGINEKKQLIDEHSKDIETFKENLNEEALLHESRVEQLRTELDAELRKQQEIQRAENYVNAWERERSERRENMHNRQSSDSSNIISEISVGTVVTFGRYTDNASNISKPITWIVIADDHGKKLLISQNVICLKPYNDTPHQVTWEKCSLRKWLNNEFISNSFSRDEQSHIARVRIEPGGNPTWSSSAGNCTEDKAFILDVLQIREYMNITSSRECTMLISNNYNTTTDAAKWWLRCPGIDNGRAVFVDEQGRYNLDGETIKANNIGIRPAMWVDLKDKQ